MLCKHEVVGSIPSASTNSFAVVSIYGLKRRRGPPSAQAFGAGAPGRGRVLLDEYWNKVIGTEALAEARPTGRPSVCEESQVSGGERLGLRDL